MTPILQLEDYYLTQLHVDWGIPSTKEPIKVESTECSFDYEVGVHTKAPQRRMLKLKVKMQEQDEKGQKVGFRIETEMTGHFSFTEATPSGKEEYVLRVNGVSMLYGTLRGILGTITGSFPGRRFSLPSIMPNEIVKQVEEAREKRSAQKGNNSVEAAKPK